MRGGEKGLRGRMRFLRLLLHTIAVFCKTRDRNANPESPCFVSSELFLFTRTSTCGQRKNPPVPLVQYHCSVPLKWSCWYRTYNIPTSPCIGCLGVLLEFSKCDHSKCVLYRTKCTCISDRMPFRRKRTSPSGLSN